MRLGYWAALGAFATSASYSVAQIGQLIGALPNPVDRILIFAPSLALAPCFVLALAAAYEGGSCAQRAARLGALALAILYAGCASIVYVNQLGVVIPRELSGTSQDFERLACCGFREPLTVIDLLGCTYMSLATLLLAPTCRGWLRGLLLANGLLALPIFLQPFWPTLIWAAAPWLVLFPIAMLLLARDLGQRPKWSQPD